MSFVPSSDHVPRRFCVFFFKIRSGVGSFLNSPSNRASASVMSATFAMLFRTGNGLKIGARESNSSRQTCSLDTWRESYRTGAADELKYYTTLHGKAWEKSVRDFFINHPSDPIALASFSSAQWMAPYGRSSTHYFYADR